MTKTDVVKMIGVLRENGYFTKYDSDKAENLVNAWTSIFQDVPAEDGFRAATLFMKNDVNGFDIPKPGQIFQYVKEKDKTSRYLSPEEAWEKVKRALWNSGSGYVEEFRKLPREVQLVIGNPGELRSMCMQSETDVDRFERPRFLARYKEVLDQMDTMEQMGLPMTDYTRLNEEAPDMMRLIRERQEGKA